MYDSAAAMESLVLDGNHYHSLEALQVRWAREEGDREDVGGGTIFLQGRCWCMRLPLGVAAVYI